MKNKSLLLKAFIELCDSGTSHSSLFFRYCPQLSSCCLTSCPISHAPLASPLAPEDLWFFYAELVAILSEKRDATWTAMQVSQSTHLDGTLSQPLSLLHIQSSLLTSY
jgi:hypothetical protein